MQYRVVVLTVCLGILAPTFLFGADPPTQLDLTVSNTVKTITWPRALLPALDQNRLMAATRSNSSGVGP